MENNYAKNELLEQVAKALYGHDRWDDLPDQDQNRYRKQAKDAIVAVADYARGHTHDDLFLSFGDTRKVKI